MRVLIAKHKKAFHFIERFCGPKGIDYESAV
jgi:hypothetical protein